MFASYKFIHLFDRFNPNVSQILERNIYTDTEIFDLYQEKFRLAFTLEDYFTSEMKIDPNYIKFVVRATG